MGQAGNDEELQGITRDCVQIQIKSVIPHFFGRELVIWGTRKRAELAREVLSAFGLQCKFFISSRPKSDTFCGQPLYTPDVLDVQRHYVIVTTMAEEVKLFLESSGFADNQDYIRLIYPIWHEDMEYNGCLVGRGTYGHDTLRTDNLLGWCVSRIGRYCSINETARIQINHAMGFVTTYPMLYDALTGVPNEKIWAAASKVSLESERSEIGNDVWIGANVNLIKGIKIGDGAIIGAGAVVTHDVEPYAVVGGVPAKVIRYRYPQEMIDAFLRIKWWDWPIEKIGENIEFFYHPERFCKAFDC